MFLQRGRRTCHRRVQTASLLDVLLGVLLVLRNHLLAGVVLAPLNVLGCALRWDFHLQEAAQGLAGRAGAADAREADAEHDLVAELHDRLPLPARVEGAVHAHEGLLQLVLLDDGHRLLPQRLDRADTEVENESVHQPWQDPHRGIRPPTDHDQRIGLLEPLAETHVEDAFANSLLNEHEVAQILQLRRGPIRGDLRRQLLDSCMVRRTTAVIQEVMVHCFADGAPLRVVPCVGEEDQQVGGEEIRDTSFDRPEGWLPALLRLQNLVAICIGPHPDALAMPPVAVLSERCPLPHEERQAAFTVGDEAREPCDDVAPPIECQVQGTAREHRAHRGAAAAGAAAEADGDADEEAPNEARDDTLEQVEGQQQPHEKHRDPRCIPRHRDERCIQHLLDAAPIRRIRHGAELYPPQGFGLGA
mmetsp:Transcript_38113/g.122528  ORF Transcript_38113/g.122528 Transcript_38113/m.122528 type:complete len:417 (+) Transcript_38113:920-2170(+)